VLATVAERARKFMRASDTVGRLGGDEFLAILPETSEEGAVEVADKLRDALRAPYAIGDAQANIGGERGHRVVSRCTERMPNRCSARG
jgi:diguanylate cyclase (GGDEF)-like protein